MTPILDVAIGVMFVFLVFSLLVSAFTELLASYTRWRAGHLWKALRGMLGERSVASIQGNAVVSTLEVPILFTGLQRIGLGPRETGPSYLPAGRFASAVLDVWLEPVRTLEAAAEEVVRAKQELAGLSGPAAGQAITALHARLSATELPRNIQPLVTNLAGVRDAQAQQALADLLASLQAEVPRALHAGLATTAFDQPMRDALLSLARRAGMKTEALRLEVERWFDDMMDRVSGWYKRKTQAVQFITAIALAFWLDVDTVRIVRVLWADSAIRSVIVAQAEELARNPPSELQTGAAMPPPPAPAGSPDSEAGETGEASLSPDAGYRHWESTLTGLNLPIGSCSARRKDEGADAASYPWWCREEDRRGEGNDWFPRRPYFIVGWLLTALAASLGAPFWFDVLKRFVSIRAAGRAPEEKPTPPKELPPAR